MEKEIGTILIVDDDEDILFAAKMLLKRYATEVIIEKTPKKIPFWLNHKNFDLILLDMNFSMDITSGKEGFYWLEQILEKDQDAVVILITAFGDVEMAVKALKAGATDFVLKPWHNEKLLATLSSASKLKKSYNKVKRLQETGKQVQKDSQFAFKDIIGKSDLIKQIFHVIDKVARTDANILILGENGTGKELIARAIHQKSLRCDNAFIGVDMGSITTSLFESELFGHAKGAFTDAKEDRMGRFEVSDKGTLFLDEIGNLNLQLQSKLLTAIQKKEIIKLGTHKRIPVDIRLICATNMPVYEMVSENSFRQDLLYRINTVEIKLPPLRDRAEDIPLLANYFMEKYSMKYRKKIGSISSKGMVHLQKYAWPGNIRELQHALERAIIMCDGHELDAPDFFFVATHHELKQGVVTNNTNLDKIEKEVIRKVVQSHEGNISKSAKELGLTRATLYRRMEKYDL